MGVVSGMGIVSSHLLGHSSIFSTFADVLILDNIGKILYLRIYCCFQSYIYSPLFH